MACSAFFGALRLKLFPVQKAQRKIFPPCCQRRGAGLREYTIGLKVEAPGEAELDFVEARHYDED
jgi:hypothetical protein